MAEQEGDLLTGGLETKPTVETGNPAPDKSGDDNTPPVTDDSKNQKGLKGMLSSALKEEKRLDRFAGDAPVDKLAQSFLELEDRLGRSVVISEEPTDEELSRVRSLLGVPESQDEYDFSDVEMPDGVTLTEGAIASLQKTAKENNLSQSQANALVKSAANREYEAVRQVRQLVKNNRENAEAELRQDLGADYEPNLKAAQSLLSTYGTDGLKKEMQEAGYGNSPHLIRFLGKIGMAVSEGTAPRSETPPRKDGKATAFPGARSAAEKYKSYYKD